MSGFRPRPRQILMVAGEASGDLHGARLFAELRRRVPDATAFGMGGDEMDRAGVEILAHSSEVAVVGLTEALKVLPRARQVYRQLLAEVDRRRPAAAVLVDLPELNLRLAAQLKRRGVEVVYYISPQIWAWRQGRVKTVAKVVDRMLVLFPFEVDFYRRHGVEVTHVGHPLVDEVPVLPHVWERGVPVNGPYQIALLPGSRMHEVNALLPSMLGAVQRLAETVPVHARLIRAPNVPRLMLEEQVVLSGLPVSIVQGQERFAAVADSHLALCASGTATLEVGLLGTPMVVLYRLGFWTSLAGRFFLRHLPSISLVNLVLGRPAVPELFQSDALPAPVAAEVEGLLRDPQRLEAMRRDLAELRPRLGESGASARAATEVAAVLGAGERGAS